MACAFLQPAGPHMTVKSAASVQVAPKLDGRPEFNFPGIVVIGDQSVGKTSVLEAISGVQLPRGSVRWGAGPLHC